MKAIRKIADNNKGVVAFMLVLFFLTAGLAKGSVSKVAKLHAKEKDQSASKYVLSAEDDNDESSLSFLDQPNDADGDDLEFTLFTTQILSGFFIAPAPKAGFTQVSLCKDAAAVPLYDLYCNWKLAVS